MWKCQTPRNSPSLALGGETGYSAMIEDLQMKKAGSRVGIIMMPPPVKPVERPVCSLCVFAITRGHLFCLQPWDVENTEKVHEKTFDYSELDADMGTTDDAIAQQWVSPSLIYLPSLTQNC